jgi:phosphoglycerate dehydrogenase-like enzyme
MPTGPLTIWSNATFPPAETAILESCIRPHRLIYSHTSDESNSGVAGTDSECQNAEILFGQPHPEDLLHSTRVRWVHLTSAGYTRYDTDAIRSALQSRGAIMTNSSTVFADPCAQHVLAFMMCAARNLPPAIINDVTQHGWPYRELRYSPRLMTSQSATIVGYGAIARRVIELLSPFHMKCTAVRRTVRGDETVPTVNVPQLDQTLADADHVINVLPSAQGTHHLFNRDRFARMKRGAIFYNVGRGDTVDQDALCDALELGQLGGAYLDVTTPEPLPPEHRLWKVPNCYITPHVAGGHRDELRVNVEHFLKNLQRFTSGMPLTDRVV